MNHLLEILHFNIGLSISRDKSKLFLSKGCKLRGDLSSIISIPIGHLPIKYLGLPLSYNYLKAKDFVQTEGWMSKSLSFAGRFELIKSVLENYFCY